MRAKRLPTVLKHLFYMFCLSIAILYTIFYIALPHITHQGKIVQVPDLTGVHQDNLDAYLSKHHLRYFITDNSGYSDQLPPFTVLQQFPTAGNYVKKHRKIYLTLNAERPPLVHMPNLIDGSIRQAHLLLKNKGLKLGNMKYVPDLTPAVVLEQWYNGNPITAGKLINKGSTIDVVVGADLSSQIIEVPNVLEMPLEEANLVLVERGIRMGIVHLVENRAAAVGSVVGQNPEPGTKVPLGTAINLWVVKL